MSSEFVQALTNYLNDHEEPVGSNGNLPFRLFNQFSRKEDLEGECIDLAVGHLATCAFPDLLSFAITRAAVKDVLSQDLSTAVKRSESPSLMYDTVEIARVLFCSIHSLCRKWIKDFPSDLSSQPKSPRYSQYGIKNTRRKMEDRHSVFPNLNVLLGLKDCPTIQWYAVYDGHGGLDASVFASKQLHLNFTKQENFHTDIPHYLKFSISKTDEDFCAKSKAERHHSGSTAVVATIVEQTLHIAWLGDSQVLLVKDGVPVTIMNPHKPDREDEKRRIEELGGCVVWFGAWRVNGTLSVSRAIGDVDHKPFISGDADTCSVSLDGSEDFLCLACDGFWDVFTGDDLVKLVQEYLSENKELSGVAEHLCLKAKSAGSSDNITVVIVFLRDNINLGDASQDTASNRVQASDKDSTSEKTSNNNDNNNNNSRSGMTADFSADVISPIQGLQLELEQKQRIPHKLLVNFIKQTQQKRLEPETVVVTRTHPHAKLPRSLRNPKLENSELALNTTSNHSTNQHQFAFHRKNTKDSLLSLATIESITELPQNKTKRDSERNSPIELPLILSNENQKYSRRFSIPAPPTYAEVGKPLGYRAPNVQFRGRNRVPYHTSIVATCQKGNSRSPSPRRGYTRSLPEELTSNENRGTKIAITNSLAPSLKPRQQKTRSRHVTRFVGRERRRSRSAF